MTISVPAVSNYCHSLFVEPFDHGFYNLRDAFLGKKIETVAHGALNAPITEEQDPSLAERVSMAVIGFLLIVPIVNTLFITYLRSIDSFYLYPSTNGTPPSSSPSVPSIDFAALPVNQGGNLTSPALVLLLESAGLIREVPSARA